MQSNKNFVNPAFGEIYSGITSAMPGITFAGIIGTYLITAALTTYFIPLPLYLGVPAALAIQFGRFAVVFMDFLNPTGNRSPWPPFIATLATIVALAELAFSILHLEWADNKFWAVFLFGGMVIAFGYILELQFIHKGAEAFGMTRRRRVSGAVGEEQAAGVHSPTPKPEKRPEAVASVPMFEFSTNGHGAKVHDQD